MSEEARAALCRGTLTGIDIEQVRAARERLVALQCNIPAPAPAEALTLGVLTNDGWFVNLMSCSISENSL